MRYTPILLVLCFMTPKTHLHADSWTDWIPWKSALLIGAGGAYAINKISRMAVLPAHLMTSSKPCHDPIQTKDGVHLDCQVYDKDGNATILNDLPEDAIVFIFYQGNGVSTCRDDMMDYEGKIGETVKYYNDDSSNVYTLRFTYRGVGQSSGAFRTLSGLYEDGASIFNYLYNEKRIPAENIVHYGHSIGGVVATQVVADLHKQGYSCHLRCDRSIMRFDGFIPDKIIDRQQHPWLNSAARFPFYAILKTQGLYPETYHAWQNITSQHKDFRQATGDPVIPHTASFAGELYERDGANYSDKILRGHNHMDAQFIPQAWQGMLAKNIAMGYDKYVPKPNTSE